MDYKSQAVLKALRCLFLFLYVFSTYPAYKMGLPIQNVFVKQTSYLGLDIVRQAHFFRGSSHAEVAGGFGGYHFKVAFPYKDFKEADLWATYVVVEQGCITLHSDEFVLLRPLFPCIGVWISGIDKHTKQEHTFVAHISMTCDAQDLLDKLDSFISCHEVGPVYYYSFRDKHSVFQQKYFQNLLIDTYNLVCGTVGVLFDPEHAFSDTYGSNRVGIFTDVQVSVLIHQGRAYNTSLEDLYDKSDKTVERHQRNFVFERLQTIRNQTWQTIAGKSKHVLVPIDAMKNDMRLSDFWTASEIQFPSTDF